MRKIDTQNEPCFLREYKRKHNKEDYEDLNKTLTGQELRKKLRHHLIKAQFFVCAYCCCKIELENSLIEHIKPQSRYPKLSLNYDNLVVSCRTEGINTSCGMHKSNYYDEKLFISPLEDNCDKNFVFYPNGQIEGVEERGKYTRDILNLDSYELKKARSAQLKVCESYHDAELVKTYFLEPNNDGKLEAYADMIKYFYERDYF